MSYKYVIFDLDGTLLDTSVGIFKSIDYTICKLGLLNLPQNIKESFIGPPIYDSFRKYYQLDTETCRQATEIFRNIYKDKFLLEAIPYEGIFEMLTELKQQNSKMAVATNKRHDYATKLLKFFEFDKYFDFMFGSDPDNRLKKSDIICECLHKLKVDKFNESVMIGDTLHDYYGACEAGIDFIGVKYGFGFKNDEDLEEVKTCRVCKDIKELSSYFLNN